jgi:hypothetical protein
MFLSSSTAVSCLISSHNSDSNPILAFLDLWPSPSKCTFSIWCELVLAWLLWLWHTQMSTFIETTIPLIGDSIVDQHTAAIWSPTMCWSITVMEWEVVEEVEGG